MDKKLCFLDSNYIPDLGGYLTPKELNILISLKYSISSQRIANSLNISVSTVEKHSHKLRVELGLCTKEELQKFAFSLCGLVLTLLG